MIELRQGTLGAGDTRISQVSLTIPSGAYAVLLGPTGCGKTTLLETIAGLRPLHGGSLMINGEDMARRDPADRGIGYVLQDGALFPTMSVQGQLVFALQIRKHSQAEQDQRLSELAQQLSLTDLLNRRPHELSGGERQRVALGRALANRPSLLLLDEPLSSLDDGTREAMQDVLAEVHRASSCTVLHVTHRIAEAQALGTLRLGFVGNGIEPLPTAS